MNLTKYCLLGTLLFALPVSAFADDETADALFTATMAVSGPSGPAQTYAVSDFSISASDNYSGYGQPSKDMYVSLSLEAVPDAAMLQWMKSSLGPEAARSVVITVNVEGANGKAGEMKYALNEARVASFSANHSSYSPASFSLQIAMSGLTINGVSMK
ncbi:MAG: hypothetical protein LBF16_09160 [Pseudomonadales bacterium]|nr:hypothetical protein [Pseudomonadales bacterium]